MSLNIVNSFKTSPAGAGGWIELARTTLGAANATINVPSIADKRYYMILCDSIGTTAGTGGATMQFNADTASNYSRRDSQNGGADTTAINASSISTFGTGTQGMFQVGYMANLLAKEKLIQWFLVHAGDGGAASFTPFRQQGVGKHAQTSSPFDEFDWKTGGSTFLTGSEVVILGWDPTDTLTDNFWEELASVDLSSGTASSISSGIFTAKKYIWIQYLIKGHTDVSSFDGYLRFGSTTIDSGNNYSWRESTNGAADSTSGGATNRILSQTGFLDSGQTMFGNFFIINNASNEKLVTGNIVGSAASGAGSAPNRRESIGKFANTSNQLDIVELGRQGGSGSFATATTLKVWGSD